ncbi:MAG: NAD(P)H-hydrate dehydratase [Burkholderiales bacterium]
MALDRLIPVYRTAEIRAIEESVLSLADPPRLMERAGLAAAEIARTIAPEGAILVFAGPGNNGGDAFVLARHLKKWWYKVTAVFSGDRVKLKSDAAHAFDEWRDTGGETLATPPAIRDYGLIVDGIFGIGLARQPESVYLDWIRATNASSSPVLALDVPSGLDSDTGRVLGEAVRADHTVTFIGLKPGLLTLDGPDRCGEVHVADLGIDHSKPASGALLRPEILRDVPSQRPRNSHKGMYGGVGVVGGASGMIGAALLAGRAALHLGAGRVYLGCLSEDITVDWQHPELMVRKANEVFELEAINCLVVGPGLGKSAAASHALHMALASDHPLVLDADALNLIANDDGFKNELRERKAVNVLTPHPAEAGRLLGVSTREIQNDRVKAAIALATSFNCCSLLKGAGTICAMPDERYYINPTGNAGMASGGMGDVLSGIIGALIAQGAAADRAMLAGVYLHGAAADGAVSQGKGPIGLTASEVIACAREHVNRAPSTDHGPGVQ